MNYAKKTGQMLAPMSVSSESVSHSRSVQRQ